MEGIFDEISKVYLILESNDGFKSKYMSIVNPNDGDKIMKIKMGLNTTELGGLLDSFFNNGFVINEITENEFNILTKEDTLKFKI